MGRPIGDLVSNLRYERLVEDAHEVLRTLVFKEAEVQGDDGSWYLMRIMPYRTTDNVIDGLVLTFVNVTKVRNLQTQTERLVRTLGRSTTSVFSQDRELKYEWAYGPIFGYPAAQVPGKTDRDLLGVHDGEAVIKLKQEVLASGRRKRRQLELKAGDGRRVYDLYLEPAAGEGGIVGVVNQIDDAEQS